MALKDCRTPQVEALEATKKEYEAGVRRMILAVATGVGKTVIFSHIYEYMNLGGVMVVLAHRDELIHQAADKMRHWNPRLKVGIEMGDEYADPDCDVIIASVATLGRAGTARLQRFDPATVTQIIVDECFVGSTIVDGKPISTYQVGDVVTTFDDQTGSFQQRKVTHVFRNRVTFLVRVTIGGSETVCTLNHPFYTRRGWVCAGELTTKDEVLKTDASELFGVPRNRGGWSFTQPAHQEIPGQKEGEFLGYVGVDRVEVLEPGSDGTFGGLCEDRTVYNLEVEGEHTYVANGCVVHNCHHSVAATYGNIFSYFGCFDENTDKLLLGVTATTGRGDGQGLSKVYEKVAYQYSMKQAIEDGWLSDVRAIKLITGTSLEGVKTNAGDFAVGELADTVNTPARNQKIVKAWLENAKDLPTVAFTVDVQHAKDLAAMFERNGVKAAAVWGDDPERAAKLELHRRGQVDVICNCGILTEGYDDWRIACIVMGRPTKSQTLFVQCIGRGTRLQEGINNLKEALAAGWALTKKDCLVIDVVDSTSKHSLITVPSIFGMSPEMDLKGGSALKAVKVIEKAQAEHTDVDFSKLQSLDQIEAFVEAANIWDVKFPDEVITNSTMSWHRSYDGSFVLQLPNDGTIPPKNEKITIRQNIMDQWEITAEIGGVRYKGVRDTIEEAFVCGDNLLMRVAGDAVRVLAREAEWHDEPITDGQVRMLKRLLKGQTIPEGITKGKASKLISSLVAGKMGNAVKTGKAAA